MPPTILKTSKSVSLSKEAKGILFTILDEKEKKKSDQHQKSSNVSECMLNNATVSSKNKYFSATGLLSKVMPRKQHVAFLLCLPCKH